MRRRYLTLLMGFTAIYLLWARPVLAQSGGESAGFSPLEWVAVLGGLALLPFAVIMVTSFVKVAVVLAILRSAIGAQGVPPAQVIIGLSLILTVFIMAPVGRAMVVEGKGAFLSLEQTETGETELTPGRWEQIAAVATAALRPLSDFLGREAHPEDRGLFEELRRPALGEMVVGTDGSDLLTLVPAFVVSELKEAFQIGFLIFIPFIVIDMVVANILLSLGMVMLSPTAVSLPFKLLLFVMVDGWYWLVRGLVMSYGEA